MAQVPTLGDGPRPVNGTPAPGPHSRRHRRRGEAQRPATLLGGVALILVAAIAIAFGLAGAWPAVLPIPRPTPSTDLASAATPGAASIAPAGSASAAAIPSPAAAPASHAPGIRADRIVVPAVGIDLPVIEGDGVDAPLGKAAHYPGTGWPGGGTNVYLYAHARDGMFIGLWDVTVGDEIDLHLVDGTSRPYVVRRVLPKVAWNAIRYLDPTSTEQLTLQTCTSYQETAPRFLVIAVPRP